MPLGCTLVRRKVLRDSACLELPMCINVVTGCVGRVDAVLQLQKRGGMRSLEDL